MRQERKSRVCWHDGVNRLSAATATIGIFILVVICALAATAAQAQSAFVRVN